MLSTRLVFFAIVGGVYWFLRSPRQLVASQNAVADAVAPLVVAPKPKDQRVASRRLGNTVQVYVAPPDCKKDPNIGSILDRSMGGMRIALFYEVEAGTVIAIRPVHADEMVPWVDIEVRSCKASTEIPGQFEVGCKYVKSPPYSIQLLFG